MLWRGTAVLMVSLSILFLGSGCEQFKEYRKKVYYGKGLKLFEEKKYVDALEQFGYACEFDPAFQDTIIMQALCYYELKKFKKAAERFENALQNDPSRVDLRLKCAESLIALGKCPPAIHQSNKILKSDPANEEALYLNAKARLRSRLFAEWQQVGQVLQPVLAKKIAKPKVYALWAEFQILSGNPALGEQILMEHQNDNPDWLFVMRYLIERYASESNNEGVIRLYNKLLAVDPGNKRNQQELLAFLRRTGRQQDEEKQLNEFMKKFPDDVSHKLALAEFYIFYQRHAQAEALIKEGMQQGDMQYEYTKLFIQLKEQMEQLDQAVAAAKAALADLAEKTERDIEMKNILARLYYQSGNLKIAKTILKWILDVDPDNVAGRFLLARIAYDEGNTLLAVGEFRGLASENAANPEYHYYLGLSLLARGEDTIAAQAFKDALDQDITHKPSLFKFAEIYIKKHFFAEAEKKIHDFLEIRPNDAEVLALLAQVRQQQQEMGPRIFKEDE